MSGESEGSTPQRSRDELVNRFINLSSEVSSHMRPGRSEVWSDIELTMHQFRALSLLRQGPLRINDLGSRLGIRFSSITNLVNRLEEKRLIERVPDPDDQRIIWCRLTPLGQRETENLGDINRRLLESLAQLLTDEELQVVVETFEILSSALRRNGNDDSP
jgi:MarR family transcriptional regulator, organic hydroperoxide resistance regulator